MYRQNFRSPNPCGSGGGEGSSGSFRSPGPLGSGSPMLPPPLPPWGYGSPHTPNYSQRPPRPYGSGGGHSPRSSPSQNPYGGGRYGGHSPGNTPPRRASPRYNVSPYNKSPGGGNHYQQHNARGYSSPRPSNYQGSPRTSTPYSTAHGREKRVSDVENYYRPSMLEDPWANLKPLTLSDIDQQNSTEQTTNTGRRGRYFS